MDYTRVPTTQVFITYRLYLFRNYRYWVHNLYKQRQLEGEFHTIRKELDDDEVKFQSYYRMTPGSYSLLLRKLEKIVKVKTFNSRPSISVDEQLTVAIRY